MDTVPIKKFLFERSFDDASVVHRSPERKPVLMKPEQIDALKQESYLAGFEAGKAAGLQAQTEQLNTTVAKLDQNLGQIMQNLADLQAQQDHHTRHLVLAIAKKILPDFMSRHGMQEIEPLLAESLRQMAKEPRLVIRVNEQQFEALNEKAQNLATARAFPGKVIVIACAETVLGDCRVEWADGGMERNVAATWNAVEQTLNPENLSVDLGGEKVWPMIKNP